MEIKVKTYNEDGSIAFEGVFGPKEAEFILEVGTNILLQQGAIPLMMDDEDDEDEEVIPNAPGTDRMQ